MTSSKVKHSEISNLVWHSFYLNQKLTGFMPPMIFRWEENELRFGISWKVIPFFLNITILIFGGGLGCGFLLWKHFAGITPLPISNVLIFVVFTLASLFISGLAAAWTPHGADMVYYFKGLRELEANFSQDLHKLHKWERLIPKHSRERRRRRHAIGTMALISAVIPPIGALPQAIFATMLHVDPFYFLMEEYLLPEPETRGYLSICGPWLLRCFLITVVILETVRLCFVLGVVCITALQIYQGFLDKMKDDLDEIAQKYGSYLLSAYAKLAVGHAIMERVCSHLSLFGMLAGEVVGVTCAWITCKGHSFLPLEIYWICPVGCVGIALFVQATLPYAAHVYEQSSRVIAKWRGTCRTWENCRWRIVQKQLAGFRPVGWSCGRYFRIKHSTRATYFSTIVDRTVDALLSI